MTSRRGLFAASVSSVIALAIAPFARFLPRKASNINWLLSSFDSQDWAAEFCRIVGKEIPGVRRQEDWMQSWFACALMTGFDEGGRREQKIPDFVDLLHSGPTGLDETSKDQLLVQCIAVISTHPRFEHLVPEDVYAAMIKHTQEVRDQITTMDRAS